jgi:GTPase
VTHENGPPEGFRSGFIAIIGRPNVGKSTLLNAVLGQKIAITSHKPQTTRNRILGIHNLPGAQMLFLDTPGIHRARGLLNRYMVDQAVSACQDVDAILLLVEADDTPGGGDEFVLELAARTKAPVILVINKIDLIPRTKLLPLIAAYAEKFDFQAIIPVSALKGEGLQDLLSLMASQKVRPTALRHFFRTSTYCMYAFAPEKSPSLVGRNFCLAILQFFVKAS